MTTKSLVFQGLLLAGLSFAAFDTIACDLQGMRFFHDSRRGYCARVQLQCKAHHARIMYNYDFVALFGSGERRKASYSSGLNQLGRGKNSVQVCFGRSSTPIQRVEQVW